ncbi:MAG: hypothetical protein HYX69_20435 [Planctomycetia bacterium]|nr:hypothetical protein [Planctomycetia bacterium]
MILEIRPFLPLWWLIVIQPLGLASAWMARVHEGSRHEAHCQRAFLVLLLAVGVTTLAAALTGPGSCLVSGTTLAIMVLAAVSDFDKGKKALAR